MPYSWYFFQLSFCLFLFTMKAEHGREVAPDVGTPHVAQCNARPELPGDDATLVIEVLFVDTFLAREQSAVFTNWRDAFNQAPS